MAIVEILAIGNELLLGDVQDTNTHWLCRQIAGRGGAVHRAALLPDDPDTIAAEVRSALQRGVELLITTGGLGPTDDDRTLAAIAVACDRPLVENRQALEMVQERYAALASQGFVSDASLTPPRRKMAQLPQGGQPLANAVGTAPALALQVDRTVIVALPGVPAELKAIFTTSLELVLDGVLGERSFAEAVVVTGSGDESVLAPIVLAVAQAHPSVYVKSRATHFGPDTQLRITLSSSGNPDEAEPALLAALADLQTGLSRAAIPVIQVEQ